MSKYYRITRSSEIESYPSGRLVSVPIYELVEEPLLTRAEAAADPEVRALVMASIIVEHLWWIRHRSEVTDDE